MMKEKLDMLFIQGLEPVQSKYIGYIFPLARELENNEYSFKIFDLNTLSNYSIDEILYELDKLEVQAIGITTNSDNISNVYKICKAIKGAYPTIPIILGGPQVSFSDKETLSKCNCDIVVRNYGDVSLIKILDCIIRKTTVLENINGISFKRNSAIIQNKDDIIDVNSLPTPQYAVLKEDKYWIIPENSPYKEFSVFLNNHLGNYSFFITGRGCPYNCAFCVEGNIKNKYHYRNVENVKKDLKYFLSITNVKMLAIVDDTLTSSPIRVRELCKMIQEVQNEMYFFTWFSEGRADVLSKHLELIGEMYNTGLIKLQIGIESGRQETLDAYNKRITLDQIEKVVKEITKYEDLLLHGNIIMGNPHESFNQKIPRGLPRGKT